MRRVTVLLVLLLCGGACNRSGEPLSDGRVWVWLDVSPSIGDPPRDPGDALAIVQAHGARRLRLRGVSTTFGNVPLVRGHPVAQELLQRLDTGLLRAWRGPSSAEERAAPTEATELLAGALKEAPLTLLSLGPATTAASVLLRRPELAARLDRVILVAGQPRPAAGAAMRPDPNVTADAGSLKVLLDSPVAITLVPADQSTGIGLGTADLDALARQPGAVGLIVPGARAWLQAMTRQGPPATFAIPALLAVDIAAHPGELRCEVAVAALETLPSPALLISSVPDAPGRRVTWCHTADAGARTRILADLGVR